MVQTNIIKNEVLKELNDAYEELERVFGSFQQRQVDVIPFEGSWTAGQVGEHILKSDVSTLLFGKTEKTQRQIDEKISQIRDPFLNLNIKMKNPDFNTPIHTKHNKDAMLTALKKVREKINKGAENLDLSETCIDFELPGNGKLTLLEWIYFNIYHTQRHTQQLKNIFKKLTGI